MSLFSGGHWTTHLFIDDNRTCINTKQIYLTSASVDKTLLDLIYEISLLFIEIKSNQTKKRETLQSYDITYRTIP